MSLHANLNEKYQPFNLLQILKWFLSLFKQNITLDFYTQTKTRVGYI